MTRDAARAAPDVTSTPAQQVPFQTGSTPASAKPAAHDLVSAEYERLIRFEGLAPDDRAARRQRLRGFLDQHPNTPQADQALILLDELQKGAAPVGTQAVPPTPSPSVHRSPPHPDQKPGTAPAEQPPAPPARAPFQEAFDRHLEQILEKLRQADWEGITPLARLMVLDPALETWQPAGAELPKVAEHWLALRAEKQERLAALIGQPLRVETAQLTRSALVLGVEGEVLRLEERFMVNGKERAGKQFQVPLVELKPELQRRLLPPKTPAAAHEWAAQALSLLASRQLDEAEAALGRAGTLALCEPLRWRIGQERWQARERAAEKAWNGLATQAQAALDDEEAKALLARFKKFETDFRGTLQVFDSRAARQALSARLQEIALAKNKRLGRQFHGKVEKADGLTGFVHVVYDFSSEDQLADFKITAGVDGKVERQPGQGLALCTGHDYGAEITLKNPFRIPLSIRFQYQITKGPQGSNLFFFLDGLSLEKGNGGLNYHIRNLTDHRVFSGDTMLFGAEDKASGECLLEMKVTESGFSLLREEKTVLEAPLKPGEAQRLVIRCGLRWHAQCLLNKLEISGLVDSDWLKKTLEEDSPGASPPK